MMKIPLFNGDDHEIWSIKMRTLLMAHDLWDVVENGIPDEKPLQCVGELGKRQKDLRIKDMTALHMLHIAVTDSIVFRIGRATSSHEVWELLKADFGETEVIRRRKISDLYSKFYDMEMNDEDSFHEYMDKSMELVNRLKFYGENIPDHELIRKFLFKLPLRFSETVLYIRCEKFTFKEVLYILQETECREKREEALHNHKTSESYSHNKRRRR